MTWIIGYFYFQPLFTTNLWKLLSMNRTKIYPCLVRRSFREFLCKFLGHTVSPFWCSRSFVVWKMQLHSSLTTTILRPKQIFRRTGKPGSFSKVWKNRNCDVLSQYCQSFYVWKIRQYKVMFKNRDYNIERVLGLYKSYWALMNKIFIYARPCVNKMTWALFFIWLQSFRPVKLQGSFPSLLNMEETSKELPNIFYRHWPFKRKKLASCTFRKFVRRPAAANFGWKTFTGNKKVTNWSLTTFISVFIVANRDVCLLYFALWEFCTLSQ